MILAALVLTPILSNAVGANRLAQLILCWVPTIGAYSIYLSTAATFDAPSYSSFETIKIYLVGLSVVPFLIVPLKNTRFLILALSVPTIGLLFSDFILHFAGVSKEPDETPQTILGINSLRSIVSFIILSASSLALRIITSHSEEKSEQRFNTLFRINPMPMLIIRRLDTLILNANVAAEKMYGEPVALKTNNFASLTLQPVTTERLEATLNEKIIWKQRIANDRIVDVELVVQNIKWQDQDALLVMVNDVTARQLTTSQINQLARVINSSSIVTRTDINGIITDVNANFEVISKFKRDELVGKSHDVVNSGYHSKNFWDNMWRTIHAGEVWRGEIRNRAKDGTIYWVDTFIYPLRNASGEIEEFLSVRNDITRRKITEQENQKLSLISKYTTNAIIITNASGEIEWANEGFTRLTEFTLEETLGKKPGDILQGAETDPATIDVMHAAIVKGEGFRVEIVNYNKSRKKYWVDIDCIPLYEDNHLTGFISIQLDITHFKDLVANLKESEEKFRTLTEEVAVGVLLQDAHDQIHFCNPAALKFLGLTQSQLLGKSSFDPEWKVVHEDGSPFLPNDRPSVKALETRQAVSNIPMGVYRPTTSDWVWLQTSAVPLLSKTGDVIQVIVSFSNITAQKEYQMELSQSLKDKETLIKEIHHRVKNNLQLISSMLYLKSQQWTWAEGKDFSNEMRTKIRSVALIHERLLQTKGVDSIEISEYVRILLKDIYSSNPNVNCKLELNSQIDVMYFSTDVSLYLGQLINELVLNAMKHAFKGRDRGQIEVSMNKSGEQIELTVTDDGVGLPQNIQPMKANSFGMELVAILVNQLKGNLHVNRDGGTRFVVTFKAVEQSPG